MKTTTQKTLYADLGDDLVITKQEPRARNIGGTWVWGRIHGHRFVALVFKAHAEIGGYELGESRISKLWVQRLADAQEVYNWDRGLDRAPTTPAAQAIVDFLAAGLAETVYGK